MCSKVDFFENSKGLLSEKREGVMRGKKLQLNA
jgi:hypothetical protein